jgi:hypothetical protein
VMKYQKYFQSKLGRIWSNRTVLCRVRNDVCKLKTDEINSNFKITVFWDVMLCSLVHKFQHFRGKCCLCLQDSADCRLFCPEDRGSTSIFMAEKTPDSSTLKMEGVDASRTLVTIYQTARHHIPEDTNPHSHCHEPQISEFRIVADL